MDAAFPKTLRRARATAERETLGSFPSREGKFRQANATDWNQGDESANRGDSKGTGNGKNGKKGKGKDGGGKGQRKGAAQVADHTFTPIPLPAAAKTTIATMKHKYTWQE